MILFGYFKQAVPAGAVPEVFRTTAIAKSSLLVGVSGAPFHTTPFGWLLNTRRVLHKKEF
jgi:hypothetical protein